MTTLIDLLTFHPDCSYVLAAEEELNLPFNLPVATRLFCGINTVFSLDLARPDLAKEAEVTPLILEKVWMAVRHISALKQKHEIYGHLNTSRESKTFHVVLSFCPFGAVEVRKALDSLRNVIDR